MLTVAVEVLFIFLLVVLPLIPAILIYRLFPNTSVVASGPLSGLTLKSSGAFSVYIVVFLAISPFALKTYNSVPTLLAQSWTISGTIEIRDRYGKVITDPKRLSDLLQTAMVVLDPNPTELNGTPDFQITVPQIGNGPPRLRFVIPEQGNSDPIDFRFPKILDIKSDAMLNIQTINRPVVIVCNCQGGYNPEAAQTPVSASSQELPFVKP